MSKHDYELQFSPEAEAAIGESVRSAFERHRQSGGVGEPDFLEGEFTLSVGQVKLIKKAAKRFRIVERDGRYYPQQRCFFMWWDMNDARYEIEEGVLVVPGAVSFSTAEEAAAFIRGLSDR